MNQITLYQFPGACSRVTMSALEEIGCDYEDRTVNLQPDGRKSPEYAEYIAINPKAKVPALVFDERLMTENAAILFFLDRQYPKAQLLPGHADPIVANQSLSDLVWCASTLHPIVRQVRMPMNLTKGDPEAVRADGMERFTKICNGFAARLDAGRWWYDAIWSIVDVYIYWTYSTAEKGGFPLSGYPTLVEHAARVRARPSFQRALEREIAAVKRYGIQMPVSQL